MNSFLNFNRRIIVTLYFGGNNVIILYVFIKFDSNIYIYEMLSNNLDKKQNIFKKNINNTRLALTFKRPF